MRAAPFSSSQWKADRQSSLFHKNEVDTQKCFIELGPMTQWFVL
jgi:hypothetical protein